MLLPILAVATGLLQALGYCFYIKKSLSKDINPNPTTWFMFAYGTAFLTVLEWDRNAEWQLLVLPIVCATLSLWVTYICWQKGTLTWPESLVSRIAFLTDVILTLVYVLARVASSSNLIDDNERKMLALVFLLCSNASTFVSFVPLIKEAWLSPEDEHPLPWTVWCSAYALLTLTTWTQNGWNSLELLVYPSTNTFLHGLVAAVVLVSVWWHKNTRS